MKRYVIGFAFFSVTLGGVAFGDSPGSPSATSATVEEKQAEKVPFGGVAFDFTLADSSGLNAVGHNYRNDLNFYFAPTWNVGARFLRNTVFKTLNVTGYFAVTQNLAGVDDSNYSSVVNAGPEKPCFTGTTSTQGGQINPSQVPYCNPIGNDKRTDYSDIRLTISAPRIYTIPKVAVHVNPSLRFILPVSEESRYATLRFAFTPSLSFSRAFWKDRISVGAGFGITKNLHGSTTAGVAGTNGQPASNTLGGNAYDGLAGTGLSNFYADPSRLGTSIGVNYSMLGSFTGAVKVNDKWSFDVLYIVIASYKYDNGPCLQNVQGQLVDLCANGTQLAQSAGTTLGNHHDAQVFWATLNYQPLDYLGLSLAWINWAPLTYADSTYRQGIISTNYDAYTTVQLGVTVTLDKLGAKFLKN